MENTETPESGKAETPSAAPMVDGALNAAKELREATAAYKVENDRREALQAREALGGRSEHSGEQKTPEQTREDYIKEETERIAEKSRY